jgi:hypothetical protein
MKICNCFYFGDSRWRRFFLYNGKIPIQIIIIVVFGFMGCGFLVSDNCTPFTKRYFLFITKITGGLGSGNIILMSAVLKVWGRQKREVL